MLNPADDNPVGSVPRLGTAETEQAIAAAERAFPLWAARSAADRSAILLRHHALILAHEEQLAAILTAERGKPLAETKGEGRYAANFMVRRGSQARLWRRHPHPQPPR